MDIGSWIPQFFYDLIGRLTPGAMVVGGALVIFPEASGFARHSGVFTIGREESATLIILTAVAVAYIVGSVLGGLGFFVRACIRDGRDWIAWSPRTPTAREQSHRDSFRYDFIHFHCPRAGSKLAKLNAEQHMCRVIMVGSAVLLTALWLAPPVSQSESMVLTVIVILLLSFVGALALHHHLAEAGAHGRRNYTRLIQEALEKQVEAGQLEDGPLR